MGLYASVYSSNDPKLRAKMHRDHEYVVACGKWEKERRLQLEALVAQPDGGPEDILGFLRTYREENPMPTLPPLEPRHDEPCDNRMCSACHEVKSKPLPFLGKRAPTAEGAVRKPLLSPDIIPTRFPEQQN